MTHSKTLILVAIAFLSFSCSKDYSGIENLGEVGLIVGAVTMHDTEGNRVSDKGVTVTLESVDPPLTTQTDENGVYQFEYVSYGIHKLKVEQAGYGTFKIDSINHNREERTAIASRNKWLSGLSTTEIQNTMATTLSDSTLIATTVFNTNNNNPKSFIRIFIGKDASVNKDNFVHLSPTYITGTDICKNYFTHEDLYEMGFNSGDMVFVKVYGDSCYSNDYLSTETKKWVYPNLNEVHTPVIQYQLP